MSRIFKKSGMGGEAYKPPQRRQQEEEEGAFALRTGRPDYEEKLANGKVFRGEEHYDWKRFCKSLYLVLWSQGSAGFRRPIDILTPLW